MELINKISKVILSGISKLIGVESTEHPDIQNAAYNCKFFKQENDTKNTGLR